MNNTNQKIIFIIANDLLFIHQHLFNIINELINKKNYKVYLVSNSTSKDKYKFPAKATYLPIPITRKPNLYSDLKTFFKLIFLIKSKKPSIIFSFTPKAGFITALMKLSFKSYLHIHTFTGQVWATMKGKKASFYKLLDCFIANSSNLSLADSISQSKFINANLNLNKKVIGLKGGSLSGIDCKRFNVKDNKFSKKASQKNALKYIYIGRINKDKGIYDLINIIPNHLKEFKKDTFKIIGPCEDMELDKILKGFRSKWPKNIFLKGFTNSPERYLKDSDILILPSRREGFCNTIIEAGACGIPTIAYEIYGVKNAIKKNMTGLLAKPFCIKEFANLMKKCSKSKQMVDNLSKGAISYSKNFNQAKRTAIFFQTIIENTNLKSI